jgi:hypothetical protein
VDDAMSARSVGAGAIVVIVDRKGRVISVRKQRRRGENRSWKVCEKKENRVKRESWKDKV